MTLKLVKTQTLAATQATITFSSIPQGETDLLIVVSARVNNFTQSTLGVRFNGSTTGYSIRYAYGNGTGVTAGADSNISSLNAYYVIPGSGATANTFSNVSLYIPNYTLAANKSVTVDGVGENAATAAYQIQGAGYWASTAAISSVDLFDNGGNSFVAGTTVTLFTVTKGSGGATAA